MPQINAQFPSLSDMYGKGSILGSQLGLQQFNQATDSVNLNQAQGLQDLMQSEQRFPLEQQSRVLSNQNAEAQLPGITADSSVKQDKANISRAGVQDQINVNSRKAHNDLADEDIRAATQIGQQLMMSQDPTQRKMGEDIVRQTKELFADREKQAAEERRQLAVANVQGQTARDVATIRGPKGNPKGLADGEAGYYEDLAKAKDPKNRLAVVETWLARAENDTNLEDMIPMLQRAKERLTPLVRAQLNSNPKAGTPDLERLGVQANPSAPIGIPENPARRPGAPAPSGDGSPNSVAELKAAVEGAGYSFDIKNYDYKFENGKVFRKRK